MSTERQQRLSAPTILQSLCRSCDACVAVCPHQAISLHGTELRIDASLCRGSDLCRVLCPAGALIRP